jgi:hypothetical protein
MVREGLTLFKVANEENLGLTSRECENIQRTKGFQEVLRVRRNLYHKEIAQDATLSKSAMEGTLVVAAQKLMEKGQEDKAANVIMQLAKLKGWTTDQASVNIFQDLSQQDLAKLRERINKQKEKQDVVH